MMSIVSKYIISRFLKYFLLVQIVVISLFVTVDYLTRMASFIKAEISLFHGFKYVLLKVPFMGIMLTPICAILSFIILFGLMNKNNELLALKSGGISIYYLTKPVAILGLFLTIGSFILSETVVPITISQAHRIKMVDIKKKKITTTKDNNIWFKRNEKIIHISHFNHKNKAASTVSVFYFSEKGFVLEKRVDAEKAAYKDNQWVFYNIVESVYNEAASVYESEIKATDVIDIGVLPDDFKNIAKKSEEFTIGQLYNYIKKNEAEGYDVTPSKVDFYAKMAFPFVCLLMAVSGAGIAFTRKKSEEIPIAVALGICFAFLFWIVYSICLSLGYGEKLPPPLAAWSAIIVFSCLGGGILLNAE